MSSFDSKDNLLQAIRSTFHPNLFEVSIYGKSFESHLERNHNLYGAFTDLIMGVDQQLSKFRSDLPMPYSLSGFLLKATLTSSWQWVRRASETIRTSS